MWILRKILGFEKDEVTIEFNLLYHEELHNLCGQDNIMIDGFVVRMGGHLDWLRIVSAGGPWCYQC